MFGEVGRCEKSAYASGNDELTPTLKSRMWARGKRKKKERRGIAYIPSHGMSSLYSSVALYTPTD